MEESKKTAVKLKKSNKPHKTKQKLTIETVASLGGNKGGLRPKLTKKKLMERKTAVSESSRQLTLKKGAPGDQEDLQLVGDLEETSDSDIENPAEDFEAEPIKKDEIRQFLKELDILKYRPAELTNAEEKKEKKKKKTSDEQTAANDLAGEGEQAGDDKEAAQDKDPPQASTSAQQAEPDTTSTKKKKGKRNKYKIQHDEVSSTTVDPASGLLTHMKSYEPRKYLLVKAGGVSLDTQESDVGKVASISESVLNQMENFAAKLLNDEISVYTKQKENKKKSDVGWMKTVLTSGTLSDKIAALTVLVQESPLHGLQHLETMINMAKKKGKREAHMASDTLKELFLTDILPDDRKLLYFKQRPFSSLGPSTGWNKDAVDKKLLLWWFESQLKDKYSEFVQELRVMAHDILPATKQKTVSTVYQLLVRKPEQEKALLTMLINKVGDPNYKLAAKVSDYLTKLVETHPNMKCIVVGEVEQLLFRPNMSSRAQYYSVCFLNQISLSHREKELAGQLIKIYFSFFKAYVKKGEVDSKMMSALLSGVNRAFPYADLEPEFLSTELENLYKIVHMVNFNTSIQALMLLYQVMDTSENISERFYVALYKKLSDPALKSSSKHAMFLNLLYKSLIKDISERRVKAFIKRLLQICCYQQPQFTCGALILLSEVLEGKPGLLNLSQVEEDSDEEEHFEDAHGPDSDTENLEKENQEKENQEEKSEEQDKPRAKRGYSWVHRTNMNHKSESNDYDPYHRNPQYCHAENSCVWELEKIAGHFHPTVSLFAQQILKGEKVSYSGDPLQDFTLIRFLDRFVYKNPKNKEQVSEKVTAMFGNQQALSGIKTIPVNSDQFLKMEETKVPVDDKFFHRFFTQKASREKKDGKMSDEDSDADSVDDDEFDAFLDKYEEHQDDGDFGDYNLDFAEEFGKKKGKGKRKGTDDSDMSDEDESGDDELDDDLSDEEVEFSDDGEFGPDFKAADDYEDVLDKDEDGEADFEFDGDDGDDDVDDNVPQLGFDEEDIEFSDDDELEELAPKSKKTVKRKRKDKDTMPPSKKGKKSSSDIYASAEQFSHMMDEYSGSKLDSTSAEALANKDKADAKQLKWEVDRDRWLRGKSDWRSKRGGKPGRKQGQFKHKGRQFGGKAKQKGKKKK